MIEPRNRPAFWSHSCHLKGPSRRVATKNSRRGLQAALHLQVLRKRPTGPWASRSVLMGPCMSPMMSKGGFGESPTWVASELFVKQTRRTSHYLSDRKESMR